jgi:PPP family 3-phenylpropionic acid transporter
VAATKRDSDATDDWNHAGRSLRLGYFWCFAAVASFSPFATLYYRERGFSGLEVGLLAALPAIALAFIGPLWGAVADALAAHRLMLRFALTLAALLALVITQVSVFTAFLMLIGLFAIASAPISSFLDGYAISISERLGTSYGSLRVWGSIGYTAAVLVVGRLMGDRVNRLFLVTHATFLLVGFLATFGLPRLGERHARPLFAGLGELGRNRPLAALLAIAFLVSTAVAAIYGFLSIRIEELGGSASLVGAAVATGAISELPVVAFGGWFLRKLGAPRLIAMAIAVYAVRLATYGSITDPEWVLPVQAMHGLSYGAFLIASVMLVHRLAGREHAATAQTLLAAVSFGLGNIAGSLAGGALLDAVGTAWLFRGAAGLILLTLVAFLVVERAVGIGDRGPASA